MPASTNGIVTPMTPRKPPSAITKTNVSGTSHSARPPSLVGKNTDQDHRQLVIETAERMHEPVRETGRVADSDMGQGCGWNEAEREQREL